ncbi:MAG TPA: hypothetical protein VMV83_07615 [Rectinemataceae bacterium]|nr:hypothetical protein [Rectinemataceae bacterium]
MEKKSEAVKEGRGPADSSREGVGQMMRFPLVAVMAALVSCFVPAQSIELAMRLPTGQGSDPAFGEFESGAMDRFFDAGLILTSVAESETPDIVDLCMHAHETYIDWLLLLDMSGAVAVPGDGKVESVTWSLYRTRDASAAGEALVTLPKAALDQTDRMDRLRALGEAAASSVLSHLRSGGLAAPAQNSFNGSVGG